MEKPVCLCQAEETKQELSKTGGISGIRDMGALESAIYHAYASFEKKSFTQLSKKKLPGHRIETKEESTLALIYSISLGAILRL